MARRLTVWVGGSAAALALVLVVAPMLGSAGLSLERAFEPGTRDHSILFDIRLPRVLLAAVAGGALAVAGLLFQALVRDSLADPYTLGVSSGASLGAVAAIFLGVQQWIGPAALAGAAVVLLAVMAIATTDRRMSPLTLLLAGVTANSVNIALILLLHSLADYGQSFTIVRWLMGGIEPAGYGTVAMLAALVLAVVAAILLRARDWNLLAVGEEWAESRGVATAGLVRLGYVAGSLLTASVTCLTGPIGFIGWIVPHALRLRAGADHRLLIPCAFLLGAAFLAVCDTVARTVLAPTEIPVGVVTAAAGGPLFLLMLRRRGPR
jgi:iron complex transport system permease protein